MAKQIRDNVIRLAFNGDDEEIPETPLDVVRPVSAGVPVASAGSAVDLTGKPKIIMCFGPGRAGKSFLCRWMIERASTPDLVLATMDAGRSTLVRFFPDYEDDGKLIRRVMRPESEAGMKSYLERLILALVKQKKTAAIDFPADQSLVPLLDDLPNLHQHMIDSGVEPVALYLLSTREEDLTILKAMEESNFRPTATALILNMAMSPADPSVEEAVFASFDPIRRHSVYRAAFDRGAIEVWLPRLFTDLVDRKGLGFQQAAASGAHLGYRDRERLCKWLTKMETMASQFSSWLP